MESGGSGTGVIIAKGKGRKGSQVKGHSTAPSEAEHERNPRWLLQGCWASRAGSRVWKARQLGHDI